MREKVPKVINVQKETNLLNKSRCSSTFHILLKVISTLASIKTIIKIKDIKLIIPSCSISTFNIYNSKYIDLLKAHATDSLARKVLNSELQKTIVKNLKFNMGNVLFYVCLTYDGFEIHSGKFKNMRISDIVIKPVHKPEEDMSLPYTTVLHIYNSDGEDLINV